MSNRNIAVKKKISLCILLCVSISLFAQSKARQVLEWEDIGNDYLYNVEIQKQKDNGKYDKSFFVYNTPSENKFANVSLSIGKYRWRVIVFSYWGHKLAVTEWNTFEVIPIKKEVVVEVPVETEKKEEPIVEETFVEETFVEEVVVEEPIVEVPVAPEEEPIVEEPVVEETISETESETETEVETENNIEDETDEIVEEKNYVPDENLSSLLDSILSNSKQESNANSVSSDSEIDSSINSALDDILKKANDGYYKPVSSVSDDEKIEEIEEPVSTDDDDLDAQQVAVVKKIGKIVINPGYFFVGPMVGMSFQLYNGDLLSFNKIPFLFSPELNIYILPYSYKQNKFGTMVNLGYATLYNQVGYKEMSLPIINIDIAFDYQYLFKNKLFTCTAYVGAGAYLVDKSVDHKLNSATEKGDSFYLFPAVIVGTSFMYHPIRNFALELGVQFKHVFIPDNPTGFITPKFAVYSRF